MYNILFRELCCSMCYFLNAHSNHKIIRIEDEEALKKENIFLNILQKILM